MLNEKKLFLLDIDGTVCKGTQLLDGVKGFLEDTKNTTIYMPKRTSETSHNFFKSLNCKYEDFKDIKHATYKTITEIIKNNDGVGLVTKEFVEEEIKKHNLCILNTQFYIKPIEFGIYIHRERKFKELNTFIQIIEKHFGLEK